MDSPESPDAPQSLNSPDSPKSAYSQESPDSLESLDSQKSPESSDSLESPDSSESPDSPASSDAPKSLDSQYSPDFDFVIFYLVRSENTYCSYNDGNFTITLVLTTYFNIDSLAKKDWTRNRYCSCEVLSEECRRMNWKLFFLTIFMSDNKHLHQGKW